MLGEGDTGRRPEVAVEILFQERPGGAEVEEPGHMVPQVGSRGILVEQLVEGDVVAGATVVARSPAAFGVLALPPGPSVGPNPGWSCSTAVHQRMFTWQRPLGQPDRAS